MLLVLACLVAVSAGCGRRAPQGTPEERTAFVARRTAEAQRLLGLRPPQADGACEAALDALAIEPENLPARLALSDAYFAKREYKQSLRALKPLLKGAAAQDQEVLYRQARGQYWFHTYYTRGNYARARASAQACLAAGDRYMVECYAIIRNSYIGEVKGDEARLPEAYRQAAASAQELLDRLTPEHDAYGDTLLVLAELHMVNLSDEATGRAFLARAVEASQGRPELQARVRGFERTLDLRRAISAPAAQ